MSRGVASTQVFDEFVIAPGANTRDWVVCDVVCSPAVDERTCKLAAVVERLGYVSRRMTIAAVAQGFGQVGATVPFGAAVLERLKSPIWIVEGRPDPHQPALIERKFEAVGQCGGMRDRQTKEVSLDRANIIVG